MKTLRRLLFLMSGTFLIFACEKLSDPKPLSPPDMLTVPFEADFNYNLMDCQEDLCGKDPVLLFTVEGAGTVRDMGNLTTHIEFFGNIETLVIDNVIGSFSDTNREILYYTIVGQVRSCNEDDPPEVLDILDAKFKFMGGTGRFEGACGEGVYHGHNLYYAHYLEQNPVEASYAYYEGTLYLDKTKQRP